MPDVTQETAHFVLLSMGYELIAEEDCLVTYVDKEHPGSPERSLKFDFLRGAIPRADFQRQLDHEGVPSDVFFAELDAL